MMRSAGGDAMTIFAKFRCKLFALFLAATLPSGAVAQGVLVVPMGPNTLIANNLGHAEYPSAVSYQQFVSTLVTLGLITIGSVDLNCLAALSTTGFLKKTGSGTCSAGAISASDLTGGASDSVVGFYGATTGSTAALPNCSNSLTYSTLTHAFGCNTSAGTGTVTQVNSGTGLTGGPVTSAGTLAVSLGYLSNSLGANVSLNNAASYFDGPSVAQGTSGTWFASGNVRVIDTAGGATFNCKLWDGTTVVDSMAVQTTSSTQGVEIHLSGVLASPAANIKISCQDQTSTSGVIGFNGSGNSRDSTLTAVRLQ
jgi:hypothetical protein